MRGSEFAGGRGITTEIGIKTEPQDLEPAEPGKNPGDYAFSIADLRKMSNQVVRFQGQP